MLSIHKVFYAWMFCACMYAQDSIKKPETINSIHTLINLTDEELNDENGALANVSGVFSALDDVYLNTTSFEFQGVFYSLRGLGSDQFTFLLNGVNQNRLFDGRPAWNNWGGVGGIYKTQETTAPLATSDKTFGKGLGIVSLSTRPSKYSKGTRISYAHSDRSYQNKTSVNHVGSFLNDWHYVVSATRRWGNEGYRKGTVYDANSLMLSLERFLNKRNSLTASFLYTPNRRGVAGSYTDEVFRLKGNSYNGNWGIQNGKKRNARVRNVKEPIFLLTHSYALDDQLRWENTLMLQKGSIGYSRVDYNGGSNPDPAYYQKMPSYWLSKNNVDFENVYRYEQNFINNGQWDWNALFEANTELADGGNNAAYVLYDDRRDESRFQLNSNLFKKINEYWKFNASVDYRSTVSDNYAEVLDLLGGTGYLDVASFTLAQSDMSNPNRLVKKGERFKYHYKIKSARIDGFSQIAYQKNRIELSGALGLSYVTHQRNGFYNYENQSDSEGKSKLVKMYGFQSKLNGVYKFSGRHLLSFKSAYIQSPPSVKQLFPNARVSNTVLENTNPEGLFSNSLSYIHRGLNYKIKLTGYCTQQSNVTETGFYFAEGFGTDADDDSKTEDLLDENSLFVQEVMTGVKKKYKGIEFGGSYDITTELKLIGVLGLGAYSYDNNPDLLLYTEDGVTAQNLGFVSGAKNLGEADIKNKKLSVGPQQAFSLAIAYSDPNYWRIKVSVNHFRNSFVDIAPIRYTDNFVNEIDGAPIANTNDDLLSVFRKQEQLNNFALVNLTGGKSWRLKTGYLSLFWSVQNALDVSYRTGGFSSSRAANYSEQLKEYNREQPLFGNRYFVGNGRTFFTGLYYSF